MEIGRAVQLLRDGKLVAFPTETVYGLGADACSAPAVRRIFAAKGRPAANPLIVHVADAPIARQFARHWPPAAEELSRRFWPGPLTLVLPKTDAIVPEVTAGLGTVGLRAPAHPLALQLLREFGGPVAAPSANRSNRISPTTARHVRDELGDKVDLILDGGPCGVGIESTVLDLTRDVPVILRPGAVTRGQIEQAIGPVRVFEGAIDASDAASSPGQQAVHYSPRAPAYRFEREDVARVVSWCGEHPSEKAALLLIGNSGTFAALRASAGPEQQIIEMPAAAPDYARRLYAALHEADAMNPAAIFIELPASGAQWDAVRDRLRRAARAL